MKCKPGDAVVVVGPDASGYAGSIGAFGQIIRWVEFHCPIPEMRSTSRGVFFKAAAAGWLVELAGLYASPEGSFDVAIYPDRSLMPIRPGAEDTSEGQDARIGEVAHG